MTQSYPQYTGVFELPNGQLVTQPNVRIDCGLYEYGPEDIGYLLEAGIIKQVTFVRFNSDITITKEQMFNSRLEIDITSVEFNEITQSFRDRMHERLLNSVAESAVTPSVWGPDGVKRCYCCEYYPAQDVSIYCIYCDDERSHA